jgi:hypothetical protein
MAMKKHFFRYYSFSIKNGTEIRLWEDTRLGNITLREQYPTLNNTVDHKGDTLAKVMESSPPIVRFEEILLGPNLHLEMNCYRDFLLSI